MRWLQPSFAVAAASILTPHGEVNGPKQPPNVLLIVLDDLGFEKLEWWPCQPCFPAQTMGYPPTPTLQALAAEGIAFTNAWASPVCSPSRMQILTGRHSHRTGVGYVVMPNTNLPVDNGELFLPEVILMGNPAYKTGTFGKWHLVPNCNRTHPTDNGFDIFQGHMFNVPNHLSWRKVDSTAQVPCPMDPPIVSEWSSTVTRQDAIAWISSLAPQDPFVAYVAFNVPHEPLQVPPFGLLSASTVNTITSLINPLTGMPYAEGDSPGTLEIRNCGSPSYPDQFGRHVQVFNWMIEAVDTEIGILIAALDSLARLDDTVIFVVSDNGTSRRALDCPLNPEHAKTSVYQLGARVPLIVWGPRVVAAQHQGSSCDEIISAVDLWTTVAETTGMTNPGQHVQAGYTLDSRSFSHLIADPITPPPPELRRESALVELFFGFRSHWDDPADEYRRSVIHESGYRYVHQFTQEPRPTGNDPEEFLDVSADPGEQTQLAVFAGFTDDGASPCICVPGPPCILPGPCIPTRLASRTLSIACAAMQCDLALFHDILDRIYAPLYCSCTTSN